MEDNKPVNNDGTPTEWNAPEETPTPSPPEPPRRRFSPVKLAVILIIVGVLMYGGGWGLGGRGGFIYFQGGPRIGRAAPSNIRYGAGDTHTIYINAAASSITIFPTDEPRPRVAYPNNLDVTLTDVNGVMTFTARDPRRARISFGFNHPGSIRLYVPSHVDVFNITTSTGTIRMDGIDADDLVLRATTGSIHFNNGSINRGRISATTGTMRINPTNSYVASMYMRTTTGSIHYNGNAITTGGFHATTGTIRVTTTAAETIYTSTTTGSIHYSGTTLHEGRFRANTGTIRIDTTLTGGDINATTTTGSIHLNDSGSAQHPAAPINLQANTGTIRFTTGQPESAFNISTSVSTGTIRINGDRRSQTNQHAGGTPLTARTTTGSIHLNFGR
ncbi:MAG: DUF4097 domain-containing protein [Defluviitaleaceae bacterium]|nr:DUF4097 domain-containing protein [Defluviitaleaceae bacterium]